MTLDSQTKMNFMSEDQERHERPKHKKYKRIYRKELWSELKKPKIKKQ